MLHFTGLIVSVAKLIVIPDVSDVEESNNNETVNGGERVPLTYKKAFQVHIVTVSYLIKNQRVLIDCKHY